MTTKKFLATRIATTSLRRISGLLLLTFVLGVHPALALTGFVQQAALTSPDPSDANFGRGTVALSGDIAMIGGTGAIYVFERTDATWAHIQTITNGLSFGGLRILEGDVAVVSSFDITLGVPQFFLYIRQPSGQFVSTTELIAPAPLVLKLISVRISNGKILLSGSDHPSQLAHYAFFYEMPAGGWPVGAVTPTTVVDLGVPLGVQAPHFEDRFRILNLESPIMAFLTSHLPVPEIRVWEETSSGWQEQATLTASDAAEGSFLVYPLVLQGDTLLAHRLNQLEEQFERIYVYHGSQDFGFWVDGSEDAVITVNDPNEGAFSSAVYDTTLVVRGFPVAGNGDKLYIYDRAPGNLWTTTSTPAETIVVPEEFSIFVLDNETILAGRFVYAPPADRPQLQLDKSSSSQLVNVGASFDYIFDIDNVGTGDATGVTLTDLLPVGVTLDGPLPLSCNSTPVGLQIEITCALGALGAGNSTRVIIDVIAPPDLVTLTNSASVTLDQSPTPITDSATVNTVAALTDLSVFKSGPAEAIPNTAFDYQVVVGNNGPGNSTAATVVDDLPPEVIFVSAAISDGTCAYDQALHRVSCQVDVSVINSFPNQQTVTIDITVIPDQIGAAVNTATIIGAEPEPPQAPDNNTSTVATNITVAEYTIRDTLNSPTDRLLDYDDVPINDFRTANVIIANTGTTVLDRVGIGQPIGPNAPFSITTENCFGVILSGGEGCQFTAQFAPVETGSVSDVIELPVTTASTGTIVVPINLTGTGVTLQADIEVTKEADDVDLQEGDTVTFTITVQNVDGVPAPVRVRDRLPSPLTFVSAAPSKGQYTETNGVWDVGVLDPGSDPETLQITASVGAQTANAEPCPENVATAFITDAGIEDPDGATASVRLSVEGAGCADLAITDSTQRFTGGLVHWNFAIANFGPSLVEGPIEFLIRPPNGAQFQSVSDQATLGVGIVDTEIVSVPPDPVPAGALDAGNVMDDLSACFSAQNGTAIVCSANPPMRLDCRPEVEACGVSVVAAVTGNGFTGGIRAEIHSLSTFDPDEQNNSVNWVRPAPLPPLAPPRQLNLSVDLVQRCFVLLPSNLTLCDFDTFVFNEGPSVATDVMLSWRWPLEFLPVLGTSSPCVEPLNTTNLCVMDLGDILSGSGRRAVIRTDDQWTIPQGFPPQDARVTVFVTSPEEDTHSEDDVDFIQLPVIAQ